MPGQIRVPAWSTRYSLDLNGQEIRRGKEAGCFLSLKRTFRSGDEVAIRFDATPIIQDRGKGMAIEYGTLVFSLPIEAKKMAIVNDGHGKCSPGFPMYTLYPRSMWNYALSEHLRPDDIKVVLRRTQCYPWDTGKSPIRLELGTARRVTNWTLKHHVVVTDIPERLEIAGKTKVLQLEPLGSTLLRITVFAKGDY
jgi:uncharacterized protein